MKTLQFLSDTALGECARLDGLDFTSYGGAIADAVYRTQGPFSIGIFGDWGTGKTSLMKLIQRALLSENGLDRIGPSKQKVFSVWFNAWQYEQDEHPLVPLIATILNSLGQTDEIPPKLTDKLKPFMGGLRDLACCFSLKTKAQIPWVGELEATFDPKNLRQTPPHEPVLPDLQQKLCKLLDSSVYYNTFDLLAKTPLPAETKVVVFIDDLDRCFPDKAIMLLEAIKLVLFQPGFIFILGVSRRIIEAYLKKIYVEKYGIEESEAERYLEKIIQLPFILPPHSDQERIRSLVAILINELSQTDKQYRDELIGLLPIIGPVNSNNPRNIIRFINNILINKYIHCSVTRDIIGEPEIPIAFFAISQALRQRWPQVFDILYACPDLCRDLVQVVTEGIGPEKFEALPKEDKYIIDQINKDDDLRHLLIGLPHGNEWLREPSLRRKTVEFLISFSMTPNVSIHVNCWRAEEYDTEYRRKMYRWDATIQGNDAILDEIDSVTYRLHPSYRKSVYIIRCEDEAGRGKNFKLKELAWGESVLAAEVRFKNKDKVITLNAPIVLEDRPFVQKEPDLVAR
jgi:hypothetical protein